MATLINCSAKGTNIISNDNYISDLIYCSINTESKITDFEEKYQKQFIKLFQENCANIYLGHNSTEFLENLIKNKDEKIWGNSYRKKIQIKSCIVDKELTGFICYLNEFSDDPYDQTNIMGNRSNLTKVGYIALLCVSKNHRQQKIGTKLIYDALEDLFNKENVKYVTLITADDNLKAKNLYEKIGFKKTNIDKTTNTVFYRLENHNLINDQTK